MAPINRQGFTAGQQITKRLDALGSLHSGCLGVSWWFVRVHLIAGGVWALAAAQTMSFMYMTPVLSEEFTMNYTQRAFLLLGSMMLGTVVGSFFFGHLAEVRGRKFAILISLVLTHSVGALCAVTSSGEMLTAIRFVVGLGLGGQQPILSTLIMELAPTNIRGRALVYMDAYWSIGAIITMVVCREIGPSIGWQAVCALSAVALLYLPLMYYCLPESPKWLAMSGKIDEALRVLRTIEQASSVFHGEEADDVIKNDLQLADQLASSKHTIAQVHEPSLCELVVDRVRTLMRFPYLARTLMLWFIWTVMAMSNSAMCVYLDDDYTNALPKDSDQALLIYSVLVARLLGNLCACALIDRIGRRYTIISSLALTSATSLVQVYADQTVLWMLITGCIRNFAFTGAWGCLFAYTPELYPTSIRVIGISYAWGISRIGCFVGPYLVIWTTEDLHVNNTGATWMLFAMAVFAAVAIFFFGIETANRDTESRSSTSSRDNETGNDTVISYRKHEDRDEFPIVPNNPIQFI